jgi:glutathione S-transferase
MIELYHAENCPYCVTVRAFMEKEGIAYISKPVPLRGTNSLKDELVAIGGKSQVPFLVDKEKGVKMYESDDIIDYVKKTYSSQ